jgi:rod shape-determining protein MreB
MWKRFFSKVGDNVAIDLGTSSTRFFAEEKGIVINEPTIVAINERKEEIIAVGTTARDMDGKTPSHLSIRKPLQKSVISDFEITEKMLRYFFDLLHEEAPTLIPRPRVIINIPLENTEVERKAVEDAVIGAGAKSVSLVESPLLGALGARLPVTESVGSMVVDLGGGTTEISVISLGGIVTWRSIPISGDTLTRNIVKYARDVYNLQIGHGIAEAVKIRIGSALAQPEDVRMTMRGRDLISGLPREVEISSGQVREAIHKSLNAIATSLKSTLESTPPELVADIFERGVVLIGGGAMLDGMDRFLASQADVPVRIADDAATCAVRGAGALLDNTELEEQVKLPAAQ